MAKTLPRPPVISTKAKRSGEISRLHGTRLRVAGDLSTLRFIRDEYLSLITTGSPARDDDSGRQHTVICRGTNWPKRCPDHQTAACLVERHPRLLPYNTPAPLCGPLPLKGAQGEAAKGCTRLRVEMKCKGCPDHQTAACLVERHPRLLPYSTPAPLCGPLRPGGKRVT